MRAERVVVDTNVLISALLQPSGRTAAVLEAIRAVDGVLLFSDETFAELASRLLRPKFDRYVAWPTRERFVADLAVVGEWVTITGAVRACRDPDDDKFLEVALNGAANCLVSGDDDLLVLGTYEGIAILTPRDFLAVAGREGER
jgi:putative PIN family toxin of toxin-antitoxin system